MLWVGTLNRSPDSGCSQGRLPLGDEAVTETCQRKGGGAVAGTEGGPRSYRKAGKKTKANCFTSFVVTPTSLKDTLKKRENGFRSCYFLLPHTQNWAQ